MERARASIQPKAQPIEARAQDGRLVGYGDKAGVLEGIIRQGGDRPFLRESKHPFYADYHRYTAQEKIIIERRSLKTHPLPDPSKYDSLLKSGKDIPFLNEYKQWKEEMERRHPITKAENEATIRIRDAYTILTQEYVSAPPEKRKYYENSVKERTRQKSVDELAKERENYTAGVPKLTKQEAVDRLSEGEKETLAYLLAQVNIDYSITGKGVIPPIQAAKLQGEILRQREEIHTVWGGTWSGAYELNGSELKELKAHRRKKWELEERERKDPIPKPENAGLDLDQLKEVREKLKELQDQEWHPTPTVEEVKHIINLPDSVDPLDKEEVRDRFSAWKKQEKIPSITETRNIVSLPAAEDPQDREDIQIRFAAWKEQTRRRGKPDDEENIS